MTSVAISPGFTFIIQQREVASRVSDVAPAAVAELKSSEEILESINFADESGFMTILETEISKITTGQGKIEYYEEIIGFIYDKIPLLGSDTEKIEYYEGIIGSIYDKIPLIKN